MGVKQNFSIDGGYSFDKLTNTCSIQYIFFGIKFDRFLYISSLYKLIHVFRKYVAIKDILYKPGFNVFIPARCDVVNEHQQMYELLSEEKCLQCFQPGEGTNWHSQWQKIASWTLEILDLLTELKLYRQPKIEGVDQPMW